MKIRRKINTIMNASTMNWYCNGRSLSTAVKKSEIAEPTMRAGETNVLTTATATALKKVWEKLKHSSLKELLQYF